MAADLSMNQIIHAAVRRDVDRTERALRTMSDGDGARAREIQRGWGHLVHQLTDHHQQEDALVWPFLKGRGVDQDLLAAMESEHQALGEALRNGAGAIAGVVTDPSAASAASAADVVAGSGRVITGHLDHEERRRRRRVGQGDHRPPRPRGAGRRATDPRTGREPGVEGRGAQVPRGRPHAGREHDGLAPGRRLP
jgi:hypothetical protein